MSRLTHLPQLLKLDNRAQEFEQGTTDQKRQPSFYNSDTVATVAEVRREGKNQGVFIGLENGQTVAARDSFDEVSTRLQDRLLLNEVSPTDRDVAKLSINPSFIKQIEAARISPQQGTTEGSRVELRNGHQYFVQENPAQIAELYAAIDQSLTKRRPDSSASY